MLLCYVTWTEIRKNHINQAYLYSMEFWKQAKHTQTFTEVKVLAYLFLRRLEPLLWYCIESVGRSDLSVTNSSMKLQLRIL